MARQVIYVCDICGVQRGPSNHWFCASAPSTVKDSEGIVIDSFTEVKADFHTILCGEACVHRFISQNLSALHYGVGAADSLEEFRPSISSRNEGFSHD